MFDGEASIEQAAEIAARHSLRESMAAMVACRDARASIKPGVSGDLGPAYRGEDLPPAPATPAGEATPKKEPGAHSSGHR